ncbi:hypothetical protein TSUD_220520 [Trifolium subterraneum]|uniref:Uncharacterized protein n=1 Tax=Trifolium subterraneum TaxID=3900 RepID=A0A2Z6N4J4_TRISU|nr:hypothetical protein TSUD_220520 [Trifolium subterraneum]
MTIPSLNRVAVARMQQIVDELKPIGQQLHLAGQGPFALPESDTVTKANKLDQLRQLRQQLVKLEE